MVGAYIWHPFVAQLLLQPQGIATPDPFTCMPAHIHTHTYTHTEPGYYEDGSFGIRIENVVFIKPAETKVHKLVA